MHRLSMFSDLSVINDKSYFIGNIIDLVKQTDTHENVSVTTLENEVRISKEKKYIIYIKTYLVVYGFVYGLFFYISLLPDICC